MKSPKNKIAVSVLALGAVFAVPALANETVHNGQRVTAASVAPVENVGPDAIDSTLSLAPTAAGGLAIDPARTAFSGK